MNMYRRYFLKNGFWGKKGNENIFIKHDPKSGGIYAVINNKIKEVKIIVDREEHWFNNLDILDNFLNQLPHKQDNFVKILKRIDTSQKLRMLDI